MFVIITIVVSAGPHSHPASLFVTGFPLLQSHSKACPDATNVNPVFFDYLYSEKMPILREGFEKLKKYGYLKNSK